VPRTIQRQTTDKIPSTGISWQPIDTVETWDRNPRLNEENVPRVAASIRQFGFVAPIVVWADHDRLVAGHTRLKAMQRLLSEDPQFVPRGAPRAGVVPVLRHPFTSEDEANAYAIADNRLNELSTWDDAALAQLLTELDESSVVDLATIGFSSAEIDKLVEAGGTPVGPDEFDEVDPDEVEGSLDAECPRCGYQF
jgi:ParB-like chromosome segregation protein Spo0J